MTGSITQSGSELTATATDSDLTYGDTLTVTVTPSSTEQPPANNALTPLAAGDNTVELYNGDNLLTGTSTAVDGVYTLTYNTTGKGLNIGENTLTVKFNGDTNMAASSTTVTVNLSAKKVTATLGGTTTKTYDGTTNAPEGLTISLSDVENGDDVSATGTIAYNSTNVNEASTINATGITLSGDHAGYYTLSNTEATTSGTITAAQMTGTVTFDGNAVYDTPLTATYEGNATSVTYQWYRTERNGTTTAISGVAGNTYTPTGLDADRALYVIVTASDANHTGTVRSQSLTVGRLPGSINIGCPDVTYGQTPSPYVVSNTNPEAPMWYTYTGRGDTVYAASRTPPTEAGTYSVSAYVELTVTHSAATSNTVEFSILPADSSVTAPPAAVQDLVYTGQLQALVTAGTADGGTMVYSLDGETYTAELPTATDAGTYTVWYMVQGDKNHNNSTPASVEVTIAKAKSALTLSADRDTLSGGGRVVLSLSGLPEDASAKVTCDNGITVTDNGDGTWTASLPNRTATYTFTATTSGSGNYNAATATTTVRVQSYTPPSIPSQPEKPSGPSTGDSDGWTSILDEILDAEDGDTITIDMNGETEVPGEIFEAVADRNVTVIFEMGEDVSWSVNGADIPADADLSNLDLGVGMNTDGIPVDVINAITGEATSVQITLAHDGDFGFALTLSAPLGEENAGYWANLYHYDEDAETMDFETAALIDDDGTANLRMTHASQYAIVIDDHPHETILPFTDVNADDWFYDPVVWAYGQGLMTGTSATTFEPNTSTTRAMIVAILNRLEDGPTADGGTFTDVANGDWYADAVNWAARVGIVAGFEDGTFRPNAPITREQMAAILYNYAQWKGYDVSSRADLSRYSDQPSLWANDVMQWAVGEGLISGTSATTLDPQGTATRAQAASILQRFLAD